MSLVDLSASPVSNLARRLMERLALRWRQARETTLAEMILLVFQLLVGAFNVRYPGGFRQGWNQLAELEVFGYRVTQENFGRYLLVMAALQAVAIVGGWKWMRLMVCYASGVSSGVVTAMIFRANPLSPILPYTAAICVARGLVIGRIGKALGREHGGA